MVKMYIHTHRRYEKHFSVYKKDNNVSLIKNKQEYKIAV